jgi:AcrR family transcriptional regulator
MPRVSQKPAIGAAALACFAELGYDATRVRHIADRAGVAESALYRHYPSKEAIAQELYATFIARYAAELTEIAASQAAPRAKLRAVVRLVLDTYRAQPRAFVFAVLNTSSRLPALPPGTVYPMDVLESIVVQAQRAGIVRNGQSNLLAAIFLGALVQPVLLATLSRPGAFDLLHERHHDSVIEAAALAALGVRSRSNAS